MKTLALAFVTSFAVSAYAASRSERQPIAGPLAEECGKQGESCKGSVRCCDGLICQSSSGGDPTCVER